MQARVRVLVKVVAVQGKCIQIISAISSRHFCALELEQLPQLELEQNLL